MYFCSVVVPFEIVFLSVSYDCSEYIVIWNWMCRLKTAPYVCCFFFILVWFEFNIQPMWDPIYSHTKRRYFFGSAAFDVIKSAYLSNNISICQKYIKLPSVKVQYCAILHFESGHCYKQFHFFPSCFQLNTSYNFCTGHIMHRLSYKESLPFLLYQ